MKPKIPYNNPYVTKRNTAGTALSAEASGLNVPKNINKSHVSQKTQGFIYFNSCFGYIK